MGSKLTQVAGWALSSLFLGIAAGSSHASGDPSPLPQPRLASENDDRITLSTAPGSPHESIGFTVSGEESCTNLYQGNGFVLTGAHCFKNVATAKAESVFAGFHLNSDYDGHKNFTTGGRIVEIAIPEGYVFSAGKEQPPENTGRDVAFVRIAPLTNDPLPKSSFPLHSHIDSPAVFQAGYNTDKPELTGDFNCTILPQAQWSSPYTISTDCASITGSSGGPVLDEHNNLIGITESVTGDRATGIVSKTNFTPITPGLKRAFEQFKNGTLKGKMEILPSGIRLIKFPYKRVPAKAPSMPAIPVS